MRKIVSLSLIVLLAILVSNCEKDDICDANTATTPKVVIDFYEDGNPSARKTFVKLEIALEDAPTKKMQFLNTNAIKLPLKTNADISKYNFVLYASTDANSTSNEDKLEFKYNHNEIYVSRACGFKSVFNLTGTPVITDNTPLTWIKSIIVEKPNIINENEVHVKIYF